MNSVFICSITAMRVVEFQSVERTILTGGAEAAGWAGPVLCPLQAASVGHSSAAAPERNRRRVGGIRREGRRPDDMRILLADCTSAHPTAAAACPPPRAGSRSNGCRPALLGRSGACLQTTAERSWRRCGCRSRVRGGAARVVWLRPKDRGGDVTHAAFALHRIVGAVEVIGRQHRAIIALHGGRPAQSRRAAVIAVHELGPPRAPEI